MAQSSKILLTALCAVLIWSSCDKSANFPIEPVIEFKSVERFGNDSAYVTIDFTDGDGDIGLNEFQVDAPYNFVPYNGVDSTRSENKFYYNLILRHHEFIDGEWIEIPFESTPVTFWRILDLTPSGQDQALEGEIRVTIAPFPPNIGSLGNDSVKYSIELIDRALHESNIVETPLITD
jgi:hypothetical protein